MKNYDILIYIRGAEPRLAKATASNPALALEVALRQTSDWPEDEKQRVVGATLKPEKKS